MESFTRAKDYHKMKCLHCSYVWSATPLSKLQAHKKYGFNGCPACEQIRRDNRKADQRAVFLAKLPPHIKIISEYDGTQEFHKVRAVSFYNTKCGHTFETNPNYVINGKTDCIECGKRIRELKLSKRNKQAHIAANHTEWSAYKSAIASLTRKSYIEYKETINPGNLPIGLAGVEGAYQLDHIVPRRIGFDLGIPPELIAHPDNLQMLPWYENRVHGANIKNIPAVFDEYASLLQECSKDKINC